MLVAFRTTTKETKHSTPFFIKLSSSLIAYEKINSNLYIRYDLRHFKGKEFASDGKMLPAKLCKWTEKLTSSLEWQWQWYKVMMMEMAMIIVMAMVIAMKMNSDGDCISNGNNTGNGYNSAKGKIDDNGIGNSNVRECG